MDLSKLSLIFRYAIIAIIYVIIFFALRIMYKDVKGANKTPKRKKKMGLEVIQSGGNDNIRIGSVYLLQGDFTIGRKPKNSLVLNDPFVSGNHAKIYLKNNEYILEDLGSTNGTMINGELINEKTYLTIDDEIKIGELIFKVVG
ncbi:MAG: FHA domain-containing protein [Clostridiaceae bacterium]